MSTGYQIEDQFGTYFVTNKVVDWVDVFTRKRYKDIIINSLNYCIEQKGLRIFGYVVMSNHLHMIIKSETGKLSDTLRDYKRFTATAIIESIRNEPESRKEWMLHRFEWNGKRNLRNTNYQFWEQDNRPEVIFSHKFFLQKLNYIHENPVRAGIVENAEEYIYSSAKTLILNKKGLLPIIDW